MQLNPVYLGANSSNQPWFSVLELKYWITLVWTIGSGCVEQKDPLLGHYQSGTHCELGRRPLKLATEVG